MTRVALFGGSFNPPHFAHLWSAAWALGTDEVDKVLVVPVHQHAFNKQLISYDHREAMILAALAPLGAAIAISDIERRMKGPSRTLFTLQALQQEHPDWTFRLLIGADILKETDDWYRFDEVQRLAPPLVLGREGCDEELPLSLPNISSSEIRLRLSRGKDVRDWVPGPVLDIIQKERLYDAHQETP